MILETHHEKFYFEKCQQKVGFILARLKIFYWRALDLFLSFFVHAHFSAIVPPTYND